jgi:hypothetical protein
VSEDSTGDEEGGEPKDDNGSIEALAREFKGQRWDADKSVWKLAARSFDDDAYRHLVAVRIQHRITRRPASKIKIRFSLREHHRLTPKIG